MAFFYGREAMTVREKRGLGVSGKGGVAEENI
jgi:hypothetical protein